MPGFQGILEGGGHKFLARQLIKGFWTPPGGGYFISHGNKYNRMTYP
jgi:hypothetical protein